MSIEAVLQIEEFVRSNRKGTRRPENELTLAEIKQKCDEFVKERDANEYYLLKHRYHREVKPYAIVEGKTVWRNKIC